MVSKLSEIPSATSGREQSGIQRTTQLLPFFALSLICLAVLLPSFDANPEDDFDVAVIQRCDSFRSPRSAMAPPPQDPTGPPIWRDFPSVSRLLETLLPPDLNGPSDRSAQFLRASRLCARSRIGRLAWLQRQDGPIAHWALAAALHTASLAAGRAFVFLRA
jgi:hypothetical protein